MLHSFDRSDGAFPSGVIQCDGNFYGTTAFGGARNGGTVFKLTPSGALTTLHSFCSKEHEGFLDGQTPYAGVIQGSDGDFYGTTSSGGRAYQLWDSVQAHAFGKADYLVLILWQGRYQQWRLPRRIRSYR